jgi:transposase
LSEGDHRKSTVRDWVARHQHTLERLLDRPLRPTDFTDDRLGIVLRRLSRPPAWQGLEAALWQATVLVYAPDVTGIRLDSTTVAGYHTVREAGVMQYGHSKDHRPDLPQLKLMAAAAEPIGLVIAGDVLAGQAADDRLYVPLLSRVRQIVRRCGLLYTGDCKMAALATRADIAAHQDYYLVPLPLTGSTPQQLDSWVDAVVAGEQDATLIWDGERLLGAGYEVVRDLSADVAGQAVTWTERVQIVRSHDLARQQAAGLEQRLAQATAALLALTPVRGRGKRQYQDQASLQTAVQQILDRYRVGALLQVTWQREETSQTQYVGRGRGGPDRPTRSEVQVRYQITKVRRDEVAITQQCYRLGWRVQVTNMAEQALSLAQAVRHYRGGWCEERGFHLLKDRPLGIGPLYVQRDDQIIGLTQLLLLGLRLLTLIESQVRKGLAQDGVALAGLYPGQASRTTDRPSATRLLRAVATTEITLTRVRSGTADYWHLTPLPGWIGQILGYLGLSVAVYYHLVDDSS